MSRFKLKLLIYILHMGHSTACRTDVYKGFLALGTRKRLQNLQFSDILVELGLTNQWIFGFLLKSKNSRSYVILKTMSDGHRIFSDFQIFDLTLKSL